MSTLGLLNPCIIWLPHLNSKSTYLKPSLILHGTQLTLYFLVKKWIVFFLTSPQDPMFYHLCSQIDLKCTLFCKPNNHKGTKLFVFLFCNIMNNLFLFLVGGLFLDTKYIKNTSHLRLYSTSRNKS